MTTLPIWKVAEDWKAGRPCDLDDLLRLRVAEVLEAGDQERLERHLLAVAAHGVEMDEGASYYVVEATVDGEEWDAYLVPAHSAAEATEAVHMVAPNAIHVGVRDKARAVAGGPRLVLKLVEGRRKY